MPKAGKAIIPDLQGRIVELEEKVKSLEEEITELRNNTIVYGRTFPPNDDIVRDNYLNMNNCTCFGVHPCGDGSGHEDNCPCNPINREEK